MSDVIFTVRRGVRTRKVSLRDVGLFPITIRGTCTACGRNSDLIARAITPKGDMGQYCQSCSRMIVEEWYAAEKDSAESTRKRLGKEVYGGRNGRMGQYRGHNDTAK